MSELSAEAKQKILELKRAYVSSFTDKIQHLDKCWQNVQTSQFAKNEIDELRSACHKLAGSSGTYELLDVSHAARELEQLCKAENLESQGDNKGASMDASAELSIKDGYYKLVELMQQQA